MITLNEVQSATVAAIIDGRVHGQKDAHGRTNRHACTTIRALERAGHAAEILDELRAGGWVAEWPRKDGNFVTLTPEGAEFRHVEIAEHFQLESIDHPDRKRQPLGRISRSADGRIARDLDGRVLRSGPGGTIPRDPPNRKSIPERTLEITEEPFWRPIPATVDPDTGREKPRRPEPIRLPVRHRESHLCEYQMMHAISKEMDPLDQVIAHEEFLMQQKRSVDGRLEVDEGSGKVKREPRRLMPEFARDGGKMEVDRRLAGAKTRGGPTRKRKPRAR